MRAPAYFLFIVMLSANMAFVGILSTQLWHRQFVEGQALPDLSRYRQPG